MSAQDFSADASSPATFEFETDDSAGAQTSEQRMLGVAKIACVALTAISLTFGALDFADMRTAGEISSLWHLRMRPALASVIAGTDAEIQARATAPIVTAAIKIETPAPRPAKTVPDTLPAKRVRVEPMAFAAASADDLKFAPPLQTNVKADATLKDMKLASVDAMPMLEALVSPAVEAPAFPSLDRVPLPRPSPHRAEETREPTPAELLGLDISPKERAKAERCLANAVYFESRSEPLRGQEAVAQVVMNRVFSPFYPKDVCAVVYQNANRHLSCQFTFACDGKSKAIYDRGSWARATRIAKQTLDGKLWVPEVAKATHYHATYVRPNWVHEMRRMFKTGIHLFYRPYNWGDGSDEQGWVKPVQSAAAEPVAAKKKSH